MDDTKMDDTKKAHRGAGRVAFLARLADFQKLLDAGYPMRAIYDDHKNLLGVGYPQFTKYVVKYARKADHDRHQTQIPTSAPSAELAQQPEKPTRPDRPKFSHNPNSGNDRDDLI